MSRLRDVGERHYTGAGSELEQCLESVSRTTSRNDMNAIHERAKDWFPSLLMTLLSIIQALALEFL
jgi:hypothetical protein